MNPNLRRVITADSDFLFKLYVSTRFAEIAQLGWNPAQQEAFLRMQFQAQQRWYETAYAGAEHQIVLVDEQPAGRILVHRAEGAAVLVDIALLPEYRGKGIGEALLKNLMEQCGRDGIALRLQVLRNNPAQRLYQRLGFCSTGGDQMYLQMEWRPPKADSK